jgi:hypothetical protein
MWPNCRALRRRDEAIEIYQRKEEREGRERAAAAAHIANLTALARMPIVGHALQQGAVEGAWWPDGWMGESCAVKLGAERDLAALRVTGWVGRFRAGWCDALCRGRCGGRPHVGGRA